MPLARRIVCFVLWSWLTVAQSGGVTHECPAQRADPAADHSDHSNHDGGGFSGECSCVGDCTTSAIAPLSSAPEVAFAAFAPRRAVPTAAPIQLARRDAHYPLPYGNGPPDETQRT
jgi:hypothetical protein